MRAKHVGDPQGKLPQCAARDLPHATLTEVLFTGLAIGATLSHSHVENKRKGEKPEFQPTDALVTATNGCHAQEQNTFLTSKPSQAAQGGASTPAVQ